MALVVEIFFGKRVIVNSKNLGAPWEYFEKELANADNKSISMRPFINTLNSNAVDKALGKTERYVTSIIPPEIYASKLVREEATEKYFADLTQDEFSKDLQKFKDVVRTSPNGEKYRFKALPETTFMELMEDTFGRIEEEGSEVVKSIGNLRDLVFANGIMAEKMTTKGRFYRFAPIYWYSWGLANSELENEWKKEKFEESKVFTSEAKTSSTKTSLEEGKEYLGVIVEYIDKYGRIQKKVKCSCFPVPIKVRDAFLSELSNGEEVVFTAKKDPKSQDRSYFYAIDLRLKER